MYIKPPEKSREIISKLYSNPTPTVDSFVSFIKPYCGKGLFNNFFFKKKQETSNISPYL